MPAPLTLWLHRRPFGQVEQLRNRKLRLRFEGAVLERWLDNLLPESFARAALECLHGIRPSDMFALLQVIGQECAGAVQFTTGDQPLGTGRSRHLSLAEVNRIVRDLPTIDPPDDLPVAASLGGVQAKVLLTRTSAIGRPPQPIPTRTSP